MVDPVHLCPCWRAAPNLGLAPPASGDRLRGTAHDDVANHDRLRYVDRRLRRYFGAGSGVMMLAVLGLGLDIELRVTNALKTLAVLAANLVAAVI